MGDIDVLVAALGKLAKDAGDVPRKHFKIDHGNEVYRLEKLTTDELRVVNTLEQIAELQAAGRALGDPMMFDLVTFHALRGDNCPICSKIVGKVYSISGKSDQYPPLASLPNGGPPFHAKCRHVISPYIP